MGRRHNLFHLISLIFKDFYAENAGLGVAELSPAWEKIKFACPFIS